MSAQVAEAPEVPQPSDDHLTDLIARAARGDIAAFAEFYDATSDVVWRMELRRWRNRRSAETAAYRRFVAAWLLAAEQRTSGLSPRAWLLSIGIGAAGACS